MIISKKPGSGRLASHNMAARKFRSAWWVDFRFNGARYRRRSPDNSRAGAKAYEAVLRQRLAKGEILDKESEGAEGKKQPFAVFAWKWFETYVKNNNKLSEVRSKQCILNTHLVPYFGKTPLNKIANLQVEQYKARKIKDGLAHQTINNHLNVLSKCLRTAQEWLGLVALPRIKRLKVPPQKFDFLTAKESTALLAQAQGVYAEMILLALKTGLRFGELRALDWSDIDWHGKGVLSVRRSLVRGAISAPKSNKVRHIPLTTDVSALLYKRRQKTGFVFAGKKNTPIGEKELYRALHEICEKAQLRPINWHTLRHTFASQLAMAGAPMKAIQELMGHADMKTTLRYAHLTPSTLQDVMNLLDENFGQQAVNAYQENRQNKSPVIGPDVRTAMSVLA